MEKQILTNISQIKIKNPRISADRELAYRDIINRWLKSDPYNLLWCKDTIERNKFRRSLLNDPFGGVKGYAKDMRIGLSIPQQVYYALDNYEKLQGKKFMKTKEDLVWFSKKFPQFVVCERV